MLNDGRARIAVLVSGGGTNLQALIDAEKRGELTDGELCAIEGSEDLDAFLGRLMSAPLPAPAPEKAVPAPPSDWIFRVNGPKTDPAAAGEEKGKEGAS